MAIQIIKGKDCDLALFLTDGSWGPGFNMHTDPSCFVQVGTWSYEANRVLKAHSHREASRNAARTQEVVHVVCGRLAAHLFDLDDTPVITLELGARDTLIVLNGGHGYEILENDTRVLEVKNGPYPGIERDKRLLALTDASSGNANVTMTSATESKTATAGL